MTSAVADKTGTEGADQPKLVTVTIDGVEISVPEGTLLIRAAEQIGVQIPRFCDHPLLEPAGACRQCLVEVTDMGNGRAMPKPAASCTQTVMPGMVIKTQHTSPVADKAQQGVMELLLINHPLDCPVCDKGGECPLQNQAMSNGRADSRFRDVKRTFPKPIAISSNVLLDRERCVLCQRCTRFSEQIAGDPFIDLLERGAQQQVGTSDDTPFQSYFSGNTVQICPVGALTGASYRFRARPFDLMSTPSICEHCSSGCAIRVDWRRSKVTRRLAGDDPQVNEEWICDKGRWAFKYADQSDRILNPLVRDADDQLVETTWPDALERAASGLREARDRGGVGVLPGGRLTEEDAYAYAKFARTVLGTNDIDFRARPHSEEEAAFLAACVAGVTPGHVSFEALEQAPTVLLAGLELEEEAAAVFLRVRKATRLGKTKVFSIAPYASNGLRKLDGTLVQTVPGGEAAALAGFSAGELQPGSVILVGERLASVAGALSAAAALATRTGAKLAWIPRRAGEVGAVNVGALGALLPGARLVSDDTARAHVELVWDTEIPTVPGRSAGQIVEGLNDGGLAAVVVGGVDLNDLENPAKAVEAFERAGFVVSLELRHSSITKYADVVLPVASSAEKAGRYVNWEGRRRLFDLTITGTGALSDHRVLHALADELDVHLGLASIEATRAEIDRLGTAAGRPAAPSVAAAPAPRPTNLAPVLATWAELIDAGSLQDGDDNLAGTAKPVVARLSAATAAAAGVSDGAPLWISAAGRDGQLAFATQIADLPDGVVWLPSNASGRGLRAGLAVGHGDHVTIAAANGTTDGADQ